MSKVASEPTPETENLEYVEALRRLCCEWRSRKPHPRYATRGWWFPKQPEAK